MLTSIQTTSSRKPSPKFKLLEVPQLSSPSLTSKSSMWQTLGTQESWSSASMRTRHIARWSRSSSSMTSIFHSSLPIFQHNAIWMYSGSKDASERCRNSRARWPEKVQWYQISQTALTITISTCKMVISLSQLQMASLTTSSNLKSLRRLKSSKRSKLDPASLLRPKQKNSLQCWSKRPSRSSLAQNLYQDNQERSLHTKGSSESNSQIILGMVARRMTSL